jgi:hypothetical protein
VTGLDARARVSMSLKMVLNRQEMTSVVGALGSVRTSHGSRSGWDDPLSVAHARENRFHQPLNRRTVSLPRRLGAEGGSLAWPRSAARADDADQRSTHKKVGGKASRRLPFKHALSLECREIRALWRFPQRSQLAYLAALGCRSCRRGDRRQLRRGRCGHTFSSVLP